MSWNNGAWISMNEARPRDYGEFEVRIRNEETVGFWARNAKGEANWVFPDPSAITHWRPKVIYINEN